MISHYKVTYHPMFHPEREVTAEVSMSRLINLLRNQTVTVTHCDALPALFRESFGTCNQTQNEKEGN